MEIQKILHILALMSVLILCCACPMVAQSLGPQQIIKPNPKQGRIVTNNPAHIGQEEARANNEQKDPDDPVTTINKIIPQENDIHGSTANSHENPNLEIQRQLSESTKKIAALTKLLVVVGFLQVCCLIGEFLLWRKSVELSVINQQAFVFVENISTEEPPFANRMNRRPHCKVIVTLKNSGLTPTKYMMCNINFRSFEKPKQIASFDDRPEMTYGLIGPKASFRDLSIDIPISNISQPMLSHDNLYVWGWVDYNDIFSKHRHRTEFCYEVFLKKYDLGFRPYGKYNGYDKDCSRKPSPYIPPT